MPRLRRKKHAGNFAFIDSQNLNVSIQKLGWKMDWQKFRKFLKDNYGVTRAFMFIGYVPEQEDMYKKLHAAGYAVVLKPTFDMTRPVAETKNGKNGHEDKKPVKGNTDADMVLWAMKEINNYDKAVIVSGDGDFYTLVEYLLEQNKLHKLLAPGFHYSRLFNKFDEHIDRVDQHRKELSYRDFRKPKNTDRK